MGPAEILDKSEELLLFLEENDERVGIRFVVNRELSEHEFLSSFVEGERLLTELVVDPRVSEVWVATRKNTAHKLKDLVTNLMGMRTIHGVESSTEFGTAFHLAF